MSLDISDLSLSVARDIHPLIPGTTSSFCALPPGQKLLVYYSMKPTANDDFLDVLVLVLHPFTTQNRQASIVGVEPPRAKHQG